MGHHESGEIDTSSVKHLHIATIAAIALPLLPAVLAWILIFSD
ncbi:hypothetical protein [Catenovulum adriaticum]|uniref:Uncharacterized protein n=1 Tax=Catenovulum adriaticum TaxID=2984846 RepID=A0ABY7AP60_9ALTE|nr:hypothetical protein [Catenovulum sp. TS8]WAJ71057.1 hypothetical protein OLW01_04430 [Catenovulum sp. TS8]